MPITVTLDRQQGQDAVSAACRARLSAEIRLRVGQDSPVVLTTTLLTYDPHGLFVERPHGPDGPVEAGVGEWVSLIFNQQGRRIGLEAQVRGSKTISLAKGAMADALELTAPSRVYEVQRRGDYRVPLWNMTPIVAHFEPLPIGRAGAEESFRPFEAELQNISVGGVAALVGPSNDFRLDVGQNYLVDFLLPGSPTSFHLAVTVRHIRSMTHTQARLVGLKFIPDDDGQTNQKAVRKIREFAEVHRRLRG